MENKAKSRAEMHADLIQSADAHVERTLDLEMKVYLLADQLKKTVELFSELTGLIVAEKEKRTEIESNIKKVTGGIQ